MSESHKPETGLASPRLCVPSVQHGRERARYEAERARRQYDAVEPENRLVARSLERVWEDRLRQVEQIDAEYESWRRQQPTSLAAADRGQILSLGEDLPKL